MQIPNPHQFSQSALGTIIVYIKHYSVHTIKINTKVELLVIFMDGGHNGLIAFSRLMALFDPSFMAQHKSKWTCLKSREHPQHLKRPLLESERKSAILV